MYTYPDHNDLLTIQLIMSVSEGDYWGESEDVVLKTAFDTIGEYDSPRMLDNGCGMGRLFPVFAPYVKSIFALEPDSQRYAVAVESAAALKDFDITVVNNDSSALTPDQQFDVVLSSHVLQHIPESVADSMIADMAEHTAPGGCIIVTTTHTDKPEDRLTIEYFVDDKRVCEDVSEDVFEESFSKDGILPVRLFADRSVEKLFAKHGFDKVCATRYYHYYVPGEKQSLKLDIEKNVNGDSYGARDVLFVFKRTADLAEDEIRIDAGINFQYSFSIDSIPPKLSYDDKYNYILSKLLTAFPETVADNSPQAKSNPVFRDLTIAKDFLHGSDLPFACRRFLIKGLDLKFTETDMKETAILLTFYPEFNTATLMLCFSVDNATTDEMVYYRQIFAGSAKFRASDGREKSLWEWFHNITGSISQVSNIDLTYLTEIKAMHPYSDINEVLRKESRRLYGIICGDEGWEYVPEQLANDRMSNQWGSRDFIKFVVFGSSALLLNFNRSKMGTDYVYH